MVREGVCLYAIIKPTHIVHLSYDVNNGYVGSSPQKWGLFYVRKNIVLEPVSKKDLINTK
jgi:hypothetical protein